MTRERAIEILEHELKWGRNDDGVAGIHDGTTLDALEMAIAALKDIEKIQIIVDTYFTRGSKSGYECMGEIDRILEPYQKGGE